MEEERPGIVIIKERVDPAELARLVRLYFEDMVKYVVGRAREEGLSQIEGLLATATNTGLAPESVDLIFVSNTFHHLPDPRVYFAEFRPVLRWSM